MKLSKFFNFVRNNIDPELRNPCDTPMIRKLYLERVPLRWKIIEYVFIPQKIADRLKEFADQNCTHLSDLVF